MDLGILTNLIDPAILFFFLGLLVAAVRSNLEIPGPVVKFLSLYLLMAIGFKGGRALREGGLSAELASVLGAAILLALLIPALSFVILRRRIGWFDAAAIAATYGSVSAVTFIAASSFLTRQEVEFSGAMTVALVVMESPAIIMAVFLAAWVRARGGQDAKHGVHAGELALVGAGSAGADTRAVGADVAAQALRAPLGPGTAHPSASGPDSPAPAGVAAAHPAGATPAVASDVGPQVPSSADPGLGLRHVLHEAFTDGAHLLLIGSLVVGALVTDAGAAAMAPFTVDLFTGLLALFLLEMGLLVARELRRVRSIGAFLIGFGIVMPLVGAGLAVVLAMVLGLTAGNATLLAVLAASGSYIVVPAVVRYAIPEALPSRYFGLALGVTFPFNIIIGIPLYHAVVTWLW